MSSIVLGNRGDGMKSEEYSSVIRLAGLPSLSQRNANPQEFEEVDNMEPIRAVEDGAAALCEVSSQLPYCGAGGLGLGGPTIMSPAFKNSLFNRQAATGNLGSTPAKCVKTRFNYQAGILGSGVVCLRHSWLPYL
jgi:hypothetical protein